MANTASVNPYHDVRRAAYLDPLGRDSELCPNEVEGGTQCQTAVLQDLSGKFGGALKTDEAYALR